MSTSPPSRLQDRARMLSDDPFKGPGRMLSDTQTACKPASRVLLTDPAVVRALGQFGAWDANLQKLVYPPDATVDTGPYVDLSRACYVLIDTLLKQQHTITGMQANISALTQLCKTMSHGAIAQGLSLTTKRGSRQLYMSSGRAVLFERDDAGGYEIKIYSVPVRTPALYFYLVAGTHEAGDGKLYNTLPSLCAGSVSGSLAPWPKDTYRVDLLGLVPRGEDPIPEWYLFLGQPTQIKKAEDVGSIPTPTVPKEYAEFVLPMYRIVTNEAQKGVASYEQLANRVNGI